VVSGQPPVNVVVRPVLPGDLAAIRDLHARAFGPGRFVRTAYRIREGTEEYSRFCRVCLIEGRIVAAVRFTPILVGGQAGALLLGPLAVDPAFVSRRYGRGLVAKALEDARAAGMSLVLLVGDEPYYGKLGFRVVPPGLITLPGPVDPKRLLAAELVPDALAGYAGTVSADRAALA
jgi:predicted N-acetyltransferase YhbS